VCDRPGLWTGANATANLASDDVLLAETMVKHGDLAISVDEMQRIILNDEDERLY
jgi:hypothetical protein